MGDWVLGGSEREVWGEVDVEGGEGVQGVSFGVEKKGAMIVMY